LLSAVSPGGDLPSTGFRADGCSKFREATLGDSERRRRNLDGRLGRDAAAAPVARAGGYVANIYKYYIAYKLIEEQNRQKAKAKEEMTPKP